MAPTQPDPLCQEPKRATKDAVAYKPQSTIGAFFAPVPRPPPPPAPGRPPKPQQKRAPVKGRGDAVMNKTQKLLGNARSSSRTMHEQTLPVLAWGALSHPLHRQLQAGLQCPLLLRSLSHARVRWHRRAQRSYQSCLAAAPRCSSRGRRCCWSPRRSRASVSTCCGRCCATRRKCFLL